MSSYYYTASSNILSRTGKKRNIGFRDDELPSAVDSKLKKAIMFELSLKMFTSFDELQRRVTVRLPKTSSSDLQNALAKMETYGGVVSEDDKWKRNR